MASLVEILLRAKDQASAEINKVAGSLNNLDRDGSKSSDNLGDSFGDMTSTISKAAVIAATAITIFKEALEFSEEGAAIARVQDSSATLASSMGLDMDEIVDKVSNASLNTVSDLDIMSSASKAMMLGVGGSAEEMAALMETAAIRGRALGIDATDAFDQIVRGIGRLSPKILDNLGIIIDSDTAYAAYAESIGKSADELTELEKRQALVNAVIADTAPLLQESGGLTEDAASKWEQMSAAQKNFWDKIKSDAAESMVWWPEFWAAFYTAMTPPDRMEANVIDVIGALDEAFLAGIIDETTYNAVLGDVNNALMSNGEALDFVAEKTKAVRDANVEASDSFTTQLESIWRTSESYEQFLFLVNKAGIDLALMDEASWAAGKAELELAAGADAAAAEFDNLSGSADGAAAEVDAIRIAAQETQKQIEDLKKALEGANLELDVAIRTFSESIGGDLAQGLKDAGLEGDELLNRLGLIDQAFGTSYVLEYKLELATDDLLDTLINDPDNFLPDAQQFLDYFTPLQDSVIEAMGKVDELEAQLSELERTWDIRVKITTEGGFPGGTTFTPPRSNHIPEAAGGAVQAAATGLAATLPHYWVGERGPEPFFPSVDGRIVSNTQAMSALRGGAGADAREIANAVKQGVKEAMHDTGGGKVYNLTMPTSSNPADVRTAFELMEAWA